MPSPRPDEKDEPRNSSRALRVALVTASLSRRAGGIYYSARIPANRMAARGIAVDVIGLDDPDLPAVRDSWDVASLRAYPTIGPDRLGFAPSMRAGLRDSEAAILHLRGLWGYPSFATARARRGRKLIVSPEGMLDPWALTQSRAKKRLALALFERGNLTRATVLHALNDTEAEDMRRFGLRNPIAVIPNGVDPVPEQARTASAEGIHTLLFLGRIHPKKGIAELFRAFAAARTDDAATLDRWRLRIAGWDDGGHLPALRALAAELGIGDRVEFAGPLFGEQKAAALRDAAAFVLPSHGEGLPISVLEAWAYGLPVLMTPQCNLPEGFAAGAAFRIDMDARLASRLTQALALPEAERAAMGRRGRTLVEERFDWERIADSWADLYRWSVGAGARPEFVRD